MKKGKVKKILLSKQERASLERIQKWMNDGMDLQEALEGELLFGNLDKKFRFHRKDVWRVLEFIEKGVCNAASV